MPALRLACAELPFVVLQGLRVGRLVAPRKSRDESVCTCIGTQTVSRLLRATTEACPHATVSFVDAVGSFDHVSRGECSAALLARRGLHGSTCLLPFAGAQEPVRILHVLSRAWAASRARDGVRCRQTSLGMKGLPLNTPRTWAKVTANAWAQVTANAWAQVTVLPCKRHPDVCLPLCCPG